MKPYWPGILAWLGMALAGAGVILSITTGPPTPNGLDFLTTVAALFCAGVLLVTIARGRP